MQESRGDTFWGHPVDATALRNLRVACQKRRCRCRSLCDCDCDICGQ